jgi:muramoyltetrapeptide carboxypeptidase
MTAVIPAALRDGDVIGVCAPAGLPQAARLRAGLARLAERYTVRLGKVVEAALRGEHGAAPPYLAADDEARAAEWNAMAADRDVRAIVLARGGYGVMRILAQLDPAPLVADPRPIVGFSDATALLAWAEHHGVRGVHGPVVTQLGELPADDVAWFHRVLTSPTPLGRVPVPLAGARPGTSALVARGRLVGGNLTLIARLVGTPWQIDLAGAIALIEEVGEAPYELDRDLTHLGLAGQLDTLRGAVIGDLTRCTPEPHVAGTPDDPAPALAAVQDRLARWRVPFLTGLPVGHGARNLALPYGGQVALDFAQGTMDVLDAAVA